MWSLLCLSSYRLLYWLWVMWLVSLGHSQCPQHHTASQLLTTEVQKSFWPQWHRGTEEHTEIKGSVPSSTTLLSSFDKLSCACPVRQYIDCLYLNHQGGTRSFASVQLTCKILRSFLYQLASISVVHFPGTENQWWLLGPGICYMQGNGGFTRM